MEKMKCMYNMSHHHPHSQVNHFPSMRHSLTQNRKQWRKIESEMLKKKKNLFLFHILYTGIFHDKINPVRQPSLLSFQLLWHQSGYNLWQFITCERDKKSIHTNEMAQLAPCWFIWNFVFRLAASTLNRHCIMPVVETTFDFFFKNR